MVELTAKPRTSILLIKITCYFLVYHSFVLHKRGHLIKVHKYFTTLLIYISITLRLRTCDSEELGNHHCLSLGASPWQIILSASSMCIQISDNPGTAEKKERGGIGLLHCDTSVQEKWRKTTGACEAWWGAGVEGETAEKRRE